ncbi:MAG: efflux RND transporter periplasmic adaptor subunit, partial [Thermodesulfobacteriota bacterium]
MRTVFTLLIFFFAGLQYINAQAPPKAPVVVSEIVVKEVRKPVNLVGTVEPIKKSLISTEVEGIVDKYPFSEGNYVKKGELIAKLDTQKMNLMLNEAVNTQNESNARLKLAQDELRRVNELYDRGIVSKSQLDNALSNKDSLVARQKLLQSRINQLKYDISRASIAAPFNGYITKEHTQVGEWLDSGANVVELIDIDNVQIVVELPEKYVHLVKVGDEVEVSLNSLPDEIFKGELVSIVPQADQSSRAFPVKIRLKNDDHVIKSSMSAKVSFLLGETKETKMVLKDSIINNSGNKIIFVVRDNIAQPVPVLTGLAHEDFVEVQGEFKVGEQVVVRGNERLRPM